MKKVVLFLVVLSFLLVSCAVEEPIAGEATAIEKTTEEPLQEVSETKDTEIKEISSPEATKIEGNIEPRLINGKTVEERIQEAYDTIHTPGSAQYIRKNFPDIELIYTDLGEPYYPPEILPFRYYYSREADKTFNICNVELTVFICDGKLDRLVTEEDINSNRCIVTPIYQLGKKR